MRWLILSLLLVATTINYLDRAILAVLQPQIRMQIHFGEKAYGYVTSGFQIAYAVGSIVGGWLLDKYGTRIGYGMAATLWSVAASLNAFAANALHFGLLRGMLGLGESANFPACNKAAAELFPPSQRATVMGVVNFGTNFAQIIGPPLFIWINLKLGWRACFAIIGGIGFLWLPAWFLGYRPPAQSVDSNRATEAKLSMRAVLRYRQTWGYALAKFYDRPGVVVLPVLDTDLFRRRAASYRSRTSDCLVGPLRHFRGWRTPGGNGFELSDQARVGCRQSP